MDASRTLFRVGQRVKVSDALSALTFVQRDFRTGRNVFHYMGIPYYRTETSETVGASGGRIYGANLGDTGLQMIYSYGSASTFGISVQETPVSVSTGTREITVQGAWTLVLWEPESIYELTGIDTTSL